jgi:hypothetical protein
MGASPAPPLGALAYDSPPAVDVPYGQALSCRVKPAETAENEPLSWTSECRGESNAADVRAACHD